jgi:hypothetical protein
VIFDLDARCMCGGGGRRMRGSRGRSSGFANHLQHQLAWSYCPRMQRIAKSYMPSHACLVLVSQKAWTGKTLFYVVKVLGFCTQACHRQPMPGHHLPCRWGRVWRSVHDDQPWCRHAQPWRQLQWQWPLMQRSLHCWHIYALCIGRPLLTCDKVLVLNPAGDTRKRQVHGRGDWLGEWMSHTSSF